MSKWILCRDKYPEENQKVSFLVKSDDKWNEYKGTYCGNGVFKGNQFHINKIISPVITKEVQVWRKE